MPLLWHLNVSAKDDSSWIWKVNVIWKFDEMRLRILRINQQKNEEDLKSVANSNKRCTRSWSDLSLSNCSLSQPSLVDTSQSIIKLCPEFMHAELYKKKKKKKRNYTYMRFGTCLMLLFFRRLLSYKKTPMTVLHCAVNIMNRCWWNSLVELALE